MYRDPNQPDMFAELPALPDGLVYADDFLSREEEQFLLKWCATLDFKHARYKEYTARRRVVNFGAGYDFENNETTAAPKIPETLQSLKIKVANFAKVNADDFVQCLIAEYAMGTPLGWHRDVPDYEMVAGISLLSPTRMRFRPYPPREDKRSGAFDLELQPRSAYMLSRAARWEWQHSIPPTHALRYSITFRTAAQSR